MKENIYFIKALERIKKIKKSDNYDDYTLKGSHILLFLEHITVKGKCALKFNLFKGNLLDKDLCGELNEDWSYENSIDEDLAYNIQNLHPRGYHLLHFLNWELHRPKLEAIGINFPINPYEPILKFIERYGFYGFGINTLLIGMEHKIHFSNWLVSIQIKVLPEESYTDLSDENLDLADVEFVKNPKLFLENSIEKFRKNRERYKSI